MLSKEIKRGWACYAEHTISTLTVLLSPANQCRQHESVQKETWVKFQHSLKWDFRLFWLAVWIWEISWQWCRIPAFFKIRWRIHHHTHKHSMKPERGWRGKSLYLPCKLRVCEWGGYRGKDGEKAQVIYRISLTPPPSLTVIQQSTVLTMGPLNTKWAKIVYVTPKKTTRMCK